MTDFEKWYDTYQSYLDKLWARFCGSIKEEMHLAWNCSYDEFIDFVYAYSDGYIPPYA